MDKIISDFYNTIPVSIFYFDFLVTATDFPWYTVLVTISPGICPSLATMWACDPNLTNQNLFHRDLRVWMLILWA